MKLKLFDNEILQTIVDYDIQMCVSKEGFIVSGFYKSGTILLVPIKDTDIFLAKARYDDTHIIKSFEDLVEYNYTWWARSVGRYKGWEKFDPSWKIPIKEYLNIGEEDGDK